MTGALAGDLMAAVIVTIMLISQSLAYALLAGLPPQAGLHASILPIILYALFGTSRSLAVGPVAVVSLMTAAAIGTVAEQGTAGYAAVALTLAGLSGLILFAMGFLKLGSPAPKFAHQSVASRRNGRVYRWLPQMVWRAVDLQGVSARLHQAPVPYQARLAPRRGGRRAAHRYDRANRECVDTA